MSALHLRPWTVKRAHALAFVADVHRKLPKVQGAMWCVSVRQGADIVGVALVGLPSQEQTTDELDMLSVLRVAVRDDVRGVGRHANSACSMLYGACWRAARAMGATSLVTYTHLDEPGTSLRAAGWLDGGLTDGGTHDRPKRRRAPPYRRQAEAALVGARFAAREGGAAMTITSAQALHLAQLGAGVVFVGVLVLLAALALSAVDLRGGQ